MFLYQADKKRRKMHIAYQDWRGVHFKSLCGINLPFNRTCNLPLGRAVYKNCIKETKNDKR